MRRTITYKIAVNDLVIALAKQYHLRDVFIERVEVAGLTDQRHPLTVEVGVGGTCTLTFSANLQTRKNK
jgi:hypothetical protein